LLATPPVPAHDDSHAGTPLDDYRSMMLQMFFEILERPSIARVLDVGPVCEENIMHFAQRVKRLDVCDMFIRLNQNRQKGLPMNRVWKHLDYAPHIFDGINLWDFIDHLNDDEIGKLINLSDTFLKPKGTMIVSSFEEQSAPAQIHSFVIKEGFQVTFRLQHHLSLPWYYRSNRIITEMLSELGTVKSFIYRNGVREFLCYRD
jgi:hypothetical protein